MLMETAIDTPAILAEAQKIIQDTQDEVGPDVKLDEVAVCFANEEHLIAFVDEAVELHGMEHFNSVPHDRMVRQDKPESFNVRFEFMRFPGTNWRIEAMCVLDGDAPLHREALMRLGSPTVIHVSYKCEDLQAYQAEVRDLFEKSFRRGEYSNSYGMFSYWGEPLSLPYLKPRVNLRDTVQQKLF